MIDPLSDDQRILICGKTSLSQTVDIYLHVVCEYADPIYIEFVTAYVPDEIEWAKPLCRTPVHNVKDGSGKLNSQGTGHRVLRSKESDII